MTWVHLKETAVSGSSTISLLQPVTWKVGDEIVLASTGQFSHSGTFNISTRMYAYIVHMQLYM